MLQISLETPRAVLCDARFERVADAFGTIHEKGGCGWRTEALHRFPKKGEPHIEVLAREAWNAACAGMGRPSYRPVINKTDDQKAAMRSMW